MAVRSQTRIDAARRFAGKRTRRRAQDATLINVRASKKRVAKLEARIVALEAELKTLRESLMDTKR